MTLPDERYAAVMRTKDFLVSLSQHRSGVTKQLKEEIRSLLRHYPGEYDMQRAAELAPEVFQVRMEPLYRMIKQYEQDKEDGQADQNGN